MRPRLAVLVWVLVLALAACSDRSRSEPPKPPPPAAADAAPAPAFSVADAIRLFEAVADCRLEPHGLDHLCPARNALDRAYDADVDPHGVRFDIVREAARAVIGHASPAVRVRAFDQLLSGEDDALVVRTLVAETDPMALRAMIFVAPTGTEPVIDAVLGHITHPVPEVRLAALRELATEYNAAHPGLFEAVAGRVADDQEVRVRADACLRLGMLQDPRALPVFDRMLVAKTPPALFDACGEGLVHAWLADPAQEHPVEAAYHRTLALLRKGPHRAGAPGLLTIGAIRGLLRAGRMFDDVPPWVDVAAVRHALAAFAASRRADPAARDLAAEIVEELDARDDAPP